MKNLKIASAYFVVCLFGYILAPAAPAFAAEGGSKVTIPDFYLTFLVATLLPILVGVVRKRYASSAIGATLLLVFSVVSGWLTSLYATGGEFEIKTPLSSIFLSFITAAGAHYGFLKPAGVTGNDGLVERVVPGGVGTPRQRDPETGRFL